MADHHDEYDEIMSGVDQRQMLETLEPNRRRGPNPQRAAGLAALQRMRETDGRPQKLALGPEARREFGEADWGYVGLCIPELDYAVLTRTNPDLISKDHETRNRAWQKFMNSPESLPYRPDHRGRKVNNRIIVK